MVSRSIVIRVVLIGGLSCFYTQFWALHFKEYLSKLERVQKRVTRMMKSIESGLLKELP